MSTDITPEQIAAALTGGSDVNEVLNGWVDVSAEGNVARIAFTPVRHEPGQDNGRHFRAVVVPGEQTPVVLEPPTELGIQWEDGGDLLTLTGDGIRLYLRGMDEWELDPADARELAAHLAAMADAAESAQSGPQGGEAVSG